MTPTLFNINIPHQIIVSLLFINFTEEFRVISESTNDEQISTLICTPGSSHYSLIEAFFKNPPPAVIKS